MGEITRVGSDNLKALIPFAVGAVAAVIPSVVYVWWNQHRQTMLTATLLNLMQELTWWRGGGGPDQGGDDCDNPDCPMHNPTDDDSNRG